MMKLGFLSAILPDASLEEVFATAARQGYDCVELACWPVGKAERRYSGVTHIDATKNDSDSIDAIKKLSDKYAVSITALGYYPNVLSADQEESKTAVSHLEKLIAVAASLGVNQVNSFAGRDHQKSVDENWQPFLSTWKPLVELAEQHNVRIGIENCPMFFTGDEWPGGKNLAYCPAIWRRMFNDIPNTNFGLNYDPSHLIWLQMDPIAPIREFGDRIFHVHAKDVRVDRDQLNDLGILAHPNQYHAPKLPGLGELDWGEFFSALGDVRYQGPIVAEVEDRSYEGSDEARELALRQCHTFLRNFVPANSGAMNSPVV
jgi:sugar phosphate isomerase/epimerase